VPRSKKARKQEKDFFFEKKKQKTFDPFGFGLRIERVPICRSFLVLFFKKQLLSVACLCLA
jgi:hypothetical protein